MQQIATAAQGQLGGGYLPTAGTQAVNAPLPGWMHRIEELIQSIRLQNLWVYDNNTLPPGVHLLLGQFLVVDLNYTHEPTAQWVPQPVPNPNWAAIGGTEGLPTYTRQMTRQEAEALQNNRTLTPYQYAALANQPMPILHQREQNENPPPQVAGPDTGNPAPVTPERNPHPGPIPG
jgi:hypothetical protein